MYIVFEGIDGAGKSTQIRLLKEWLEANGFRVETLVEPTDSEVGKLIRRILQRPDATTDRIQKTLGLLFAADRMLIMDKLEDKKLSFQIGLSYLHLHIRNLLNGLKFLTDMLKNLICCY